MSTSAHRRVSARAFVCLILCCAAGFAAVARAQDYPTKPIRMVFPYASGGEADAFARAVAEEVRDRLGQPVIVDSRPGANTAIAAEIVSRSLNDGYTLLYSAWSTLTTNFVMYPKLPYRLEDFEPISTFYRAPLGIAVRKDFPASSLKDLIAYARNKGSVAYGTSGAGSSGNLMLARLARATGVKFEHVAYKGDAPVVQDVLGGHLPMFAGALNTAAQHVAAGTLKVIAHSSGERLPAYPDIATFRDAGFEDQVFNYWHGLAAPAGTPRAIVDRLNSAVAGAADSKRVRSVMTPFQTVSTTSPEAFGELIRRDIATWGPVIRELNLVQ